MWHFQNVPKAVLSFIVLLKKCALVNHKCLEYWDVWFVCVLLGFILLGWSAFHHQSWKNEVVTQPYVHPKGKSSLWPGEIPHVFSERTNPRIKLWSAALYVLDEYNLICGLGVGVIIHMVWLWEVIVHIMIGWLDGWSGCRWETLRYSQELGWRAAS